MKIIIFVTLLGILMFVVSENIFFEEKERIDFDNLEKALNPVIRTLHPKSEISYISNSDISIYYQTQFLIAPNIINKNSSEDTVLVVNLENQEPAVIDTNKYSSLVSENIGNYHVNLYVLNNRK